jgi:adenine C2-methylase RlmN of 23S rRNA A2503 and tRNA A37
VIIGLLGLAIGIAGWSLPPPLWQFLGYILPFLAIAISAVALILWWNTGRRVFRLIAKTSSLERDLRRIHETLDDSSKRIDDQIKMVRGVKDEAEKKEEMYEKVKRMVG